MKGGFEIGVLDRFLDLGYCMGKIVPGSMSTVRVMLV